MLGVIEYNMINMINIIMIGNIILIRLKIYFICLLNLSGLNRKWLIIELSVGNVRVIINIMFIIIVKIIFSSFNMILLWLFFIL